MTPFILQGSSNLKPPNKFKTRFSSLEIVLYFIIHLLHPIALSLLKSVEPQFCPLPAFRSLSHTALSLVYKVRDACNSHIFVSMGTVFCRTTFLLLFLPSNHAFSIFLAEKKYLSSVLHVKNVWSLIYTTEVIYFQLFISCNIFLYLVTALTYCFLID